MHPTSDPDPHGDPAGANPAEHDPAEHDPAGANPAGANPAEHDPAGANPAEHDPAGANPAGANPAGAADAPGRGGDRGLAGVAGLLANIALGIVLGAVALLLTAWLVGGDAAVEDAWPAYVAGSALLGGFVVALIAFVVGVVTTLRHRTRPRPWLALALFPSLLTLVVLAELLVLE